MKQILLALLFLPLCSGGQIITTVAGSEYMPTNYGDGGPATAAELTYPMNLVFDDTGNYYIVNAEPPYVRKVDTAGIITTIAGDSTGFAGDGGPASAAKFGGTDGIAIDNAGNLFIADFDNERIREISATGIVSTVAGNGTAGYGGDNGPATAAMLHSPTSVAIDHAGNLYCTERVNNCVRKITPAGIITTVAGNGTSGYAGDGGPATAATLYGPFGVGFDAAGNMYIADTYNNAIRKVTTSGIITTIAGNGIAGSSGDGGPASAAELNTPDEVIADSAGNIFFSDAGNNTVREISTAGIITTIAGNGTDGYYGDGGPATAAEMDQPYGLRFDRHGNLYIADNIFSIIRMVNLGTPLKTAIVQQGNILLSPNPVRDQLFINADEAVRKVVITDITGQTVISENFSSKRVSIDCGALMPGIYFVKIDGTDHPGLVPKKFVKE